MGAAASDTTPAPFLSIVIPAHDEERRLPATLSRLAAWLDAQPFASEVIVVENGSRDRTAEVAAEAATRDPRLRVLREARAGKGRAVRTGMLAARGELRCFCDADFSMPVEELSRFLPPHLADYDLAIASRESPGAARHGEPEYRHLMGRAFNALVRWLLLPGLHDTQCGFKCFRGTVADELFELQTLSGFSFDLELLAVARRRGHRIVEVPIPFHYDPDTRVRPLLDSLLMARDLLRVRHRLARGAYDRPTRPQT
jgi:glycosyltransferase involved in cell wall biosynthesis